MIGVLIYITIDNIIEEIQYKRVKAEMELSESLKMMKNDRKRLLEENFNLYTKNKELEKENLWLKNHQEIKIINLKED